MIWYLVGHDNWCKVAIGPDRFYFDVASRASKLYTNFVDAADYTANLLASKWNNRNLYLSLSGGLDSELCAYTLLRNKIEFTPLIVKIENINEIESWFAEYWCYTNKITPHIIHISSEQLYNNLFKDHILEMIRAGNFKKNNIGILLNLFIADYVEKLNGYCISASGDIKYDFDKKLFCCNSFDFGIEIHRPNQHPSGFFIYTPEIALSYIYQFDPSIDEQYNKLNFYGVTARPKIDLIGNIIDPNPIIKKACDFAFDRNPIYEPHWHGTRQDIIDILKPL